MWRHPRTRSVVGIVVAMAAFTAPLLLFALRPEPRLIEWFGIPSEPPPGSPAVFASVTVEFSGPLRRFVVLKDVEFRDSSGTYVLVQAWVNTGVGGGVFYADTLDEYGGVELIEVRDYRIPDSRLGIVLKLRATETASGLREYAGPNQVTLKYTYAGWPITRHLSWDPNAR